MDCTACEEALLGADRLEAEVADPALVAHLAGCPDCRGFLDSLRQIKPALDRCAVAEPSEALMTAVLTEALRLRPALPARDPLPARLALGRIVLAGLAALPLVVLINAALGWAVYALAAIWLPQTLALYCIGVFIVWASLGVSLSYASIPFLPMLATRQPPRGRAPAP